MIYFIYRSVISKYYDQTIDESNRDNFRRQESHESNDTEKSALEKKYNQTLKKVKHCLEQKDTIEEIMRKYPKALESTFAQAIEGRRLRIDALLNIAGLVTDEDKLEYQKALEYSNAGFAIIYV